MIKCIKIILLLIFFQNQAFGCSFSVSPLNFGIYNPITNSDANSSTNINVQGCLVSILVNFKFNAGNSGNYNQRYLNSTTSTDQLNYNLYLDAARTKIWGDGTQNSTFYSNLLSLNLSGYSIPVYSKIEKKQQVSPAMYVDTIQLYVGF